LDFLFRVMKHIFSPPFGKLALLAVLPVLTALSRLDTDFPNRILDRLLAYQQAYPREKVYVQTDRAQYMVGETIWLKATLFDGAAHRADSVSRVVYVDLLETDSRRIILSRLFRADNGHAPGEMRLPDSLAAGSYVLRAYTGWMRNFSEEDYAYKPVVIYRPDGVKPAPAAAGEPDVQLFPEGGELITGLEARVAFKAVGPDGRGLDSEGFVLSSAGDTVIGFTSLHRGMGYFHLTPQPDLSYTAYLNFADGRKLSRKLPSQRPQGFGITVDNLSNAANVRVYIRNNKPAGTPGQYTLVAQSRGRLLHLARGPLDRKAAVASIPREKLPEGITQLTLFDETDKPVCERLIFNDRNNRLTISLKAQKAAFGPREPVQVELSATDSGGQPVQGNFAVSVVDERQVPEKEPFGSDLTNYLLLSSDLRGAIEQPGYYFDPRHTDRLMKLDLLLMTQGWRRFTWPEVFQDSYAATKYPIETGLLLTGQVLRANKKPAEKARLTVMFIAPDSTREFAMLEADEAGRFDLAEQAWRDSTRVMLQANLGNNRNLTVQLTNLFRPSVTLTRIPFLPVSIASDELAEYLKRTKEYLDIEQQIRRNREILLQEVTIRKKREEPRDSRKIYGQADATLKLDQTNTAGALTIFDVLRSRVAGVQVTGSGMNATVQIRGSANFSGVVEPLFLLDGMPVQKETISAISVQDVESIDVLKGASAALFGSQGGGGVISVLTKKGGGNYDWSKEAAPGTLITQLRGYATVREFYAPRYDQIKPDSEAYRRPDYRATLHWAPMVTTDASGKATVTFYASDARTTLRLRAEGAAPDGRPGVAQTTLTVR